MITWRQIAVGMALALIGTSAAAQDADLVLYNGKVVTVDASSSVQEGLAIRGGRIAAVGSSAVVRKLAGSGTRSIDLQGRTVIPGLIDSHMHATRAALSFSTEVNWIGAVSLADALERLRKAAAAARPGAWLVVATPPATLEAFPERRRPTQRELVDAAPNHPVYVQLGYGWAMLTPKAFEALGIRTDADLPAQVRFDRDSTGTLTGALTGNMVPLFDRLPRPGFDDQVAGTKLFFRELNRLALTGVVDPGGNNMTPTEYQALFKVWRDGEMSVRVVFSLCGITPGKEFDELQQYLAMMPQGFGDDLLRFNGIGERITWAMNGISGVPTPDVREAYVKIVRWAAQRGLSLTMHWDSDKNVDELLRIFEDVNTETPIAPLRWTIAHLNDASPATLQRMKQLGVGWTVQGAMYNRGDGAAKEAGDAVKRMPPVVTGAKLGVPIGAGTDAHRVSTYNPFTTLQWLLDGRNASGTPLRGPEETPSRIEALRLYTLGSAWVAHAEDRRGTLEVGKLADLAVLSGDYLTVPIDRIGQLQSVLTLVGGRVVYADAPFAALESAR
ncbi:MAG: amidohydrolase [Vicinamibacterales bacterium]